MDNLFMIFLLKINNFCHQKLNNVVEKEVVKKDVDDELVLKS